MTPQIAIVLAILVVAAFSILAALASQVMPNPAVAVLLAPIAFNTANDLGMPPLRTDDDSGFVCLRCLPESGCPPG